MAGPAGPDWPQVERRLRRATAADPRNARAWFELGLACFAQRRLQEAVDAARRAAALMPGHPEVQRALGTFLAMTGRLAEAVGPLAVAARHNPSSAEVQSNLGQALLGLDRFAEAEGPLREAVRLDPSNAATQGHLGNALADQAAGDEALPFYRRCAELRPEPHLLSNVVMALSMAPDADASALREATAAVARAVAPPPGQALQPAVARAPAGRRVRIGYLSRDLRRHAMARFLPHVVQRHDRSLFEVCFYDDGDAPDDVTALYRAAADLWTPCHGMDDGALAERIRADGIDVLVDLAGHSDRHRLAVFARRPAPLQLTWLGFPATTGLAEIDLRVSDRFIDPLPPGPPIDSSERPLRLDHGYFCFAPPPGAPPVAPLPADAAGSVTFGSLNQVRKLNPPLFTLWARVLAAVPGSRLLLQHRAAMDPGTQQRTQRLFAAQGIAPERLVFRPVLPEPAYLDAYAEIDIALDSAPYNGGTTSCEALWQGVPVVSRVGQRHVGRLGLSLLNQIGLPELAATDDEAFVAAAVTLAGDLPGLRTLRATMRQRMAGSPLMDAEGFTRELEAALRDALAQAAA